MTMASSLMRTDRTWRTLVAGGLLIVAVGFLPRDVEYRGNEEAFPYRKLHWSDSAAVILGGDSRVVYGVAPESLAAELPPRGNTPTRVLNFGFHNLGYSTDYLAQLDRALDDRQPGATVVLGISPHSLTGSAAHTNLFTIAAGSAGGLEEWKADLFGSWWGPHFAAFRTGRIRKLLGRNNDAQVEIFHPDGWIEALSQQPDEREELRIYPAKFASNPVSPQVIETVLQSVRDWSQRGVRVYGFRPPTTDAMVELENRLSGFLEPEFVTAFQSAGGVWIEVPNDYPTLDGSHLLAGSARRLGADMGQVIVRVTREYPPEPMASDRPERRRPDGAIRPVSAETPEIAGAPGPAVDRPAQ